MNTEPAGFDAIVLGAGAAGLMCAIEAGKRGRRVVVLEGAERAGKKILISGGGRCNFTNLHCGPENFLSANPHFAKSALSRYTPAHFIALVERHRIAYHEKTLGQLFCDRAASDITDMLEEECLAAGVRIVVQSPIREVRRTTEFLVRAGQAGYRAPALVIATGGLSIPKMGATGIGYDLARQFGMRVIPCRPALVPLTFGSQDRRQFCDLAGVSAECVASFEGVRFREKMLITHRGLSGPAILQISSYWRPGEAVGIDLAPDRDLGSELLGSARRDLSVARNVLRAALPVRLADRWLDLNAPSRWTNQAIADLDRLVHAWRVTPEGTEGFAKAEVTAGGVDTDALSAKTFESKSVPGLFFIGEVVDVTGHLGGFNFQWAWAPVSAQDKLCEMLNRMDPLLQWRSEFPILERTVYMISHSLGAMPLRTRDRLNEFADTWATRGIRAWEEGWWNMPIAVGDLVGKIIGAGPGEVVMTQNVSTGQAMVLSCFDWSGRRNKLVTEEMNFPSNLYNFHGLEGARVVQVPSADGITIPLEHMLATIDEQTTLVSVSHVLFRSSFVQDIAAITRRAHEVGAMVCADIYQSAGTVPLDVREIGVDFATGGSVKWLCGGPGAGYVYVRRDLWPNLRPRFTGWMAHKDPFAFEAGPIQYADDAFRFLNGTPNVPALYSARSGYEIVGEIGVTAIREKSLRQTRALIESAKAAGFRLNSPERDDERGGVVVIDVPGGLEITKELSRRDILVDYRPGAGIRVAPHFYTTDSEIDQTLEEIRKLAGAHYHRYAEGD